MARAFISIGSNLGDRLTKLSQAAVRLGASPGVCAVQMAPIYETAPVGGPEQDPFLNTILEIDTSLSPQELLKRLKIIEHDMGRTPGGPRWGPREIDLDLLMYDDLVLSESDLTVPHPQLHRRRFVLEPLACLVPQWRHPVLGKTVAELLQELGPGQAVMSYSGDPES